VATLVELIQEAGFDPSDEEQRDAFFAYWWKPGCGTTRRQAAVLAQIRVRPDGTTCMPGVDEDCPVTLPPAGVIPGREVPEPTDRRPAPFSPDAPYCDQVRFAVKQLDDHPAPMVRRLVPEMRAAQYARVPRRRPMVRHLVPGRDPGTFELEPVEVTERGELIREAGPTGRFTLQAVPAPPGVTLPLRGFAFSLLRRIADRCPSAGPDFCFGAMDDLRAAVRRAQARQISIPDSVLSDLERCFETHNDFEAQLEQLRREQPPDPEICPAPRDDAGPGAFIPS